MLFCITFCSVRRRCRTFDCKICTYLCTETGSEDVQLRLEPSKEAETHRKSMEIRKDRPETMKTNENRSKINENPSKVNKNQ